MPPAVANANNVNRLDNIERLRLSVDRILPLHGRVVPVSDLYVATLRRRVDADALHAAKPTLTPKHAPQP